ncbi:two-component system response regulator [Hydrococcus rivularis NIES-593]|uniref:Two-component system response regulator n=1 Tax=Hydrococcus rivularis NIES-593 TaxID=1921803 RepID=A0A1U7HMQ6_9CYAN|nr:response regulator [Hydrococcus rivularis]OKH24857.1 two-component system response regulator [Hydrococcus rivularis NIES-593]
MSTHKVLVIDDSKVIRMRVRDMLPPNTFEVIEAKDGLEGYNLIRSENPNLIVLDFLLPKMSGWEVYQELQKEYQLKTIPLVVMSGRKEEVMEKIPEPFDYFAFVEKPFDQKQLVDAIREAMAKAKKHPRPVEFASTNNVGTAASSSSDTAAEIQTLNAKIAQMQDEINSLKKQLSQLIVFIKQRIK